MMANKKSESQHRLETSRRQEEPFNNPFISGELTEAARTRESLGAVAKGPTCPDGAGGGRQRFVLQMVEEISGENHCSGLIHESHWDSCSHSYPFREDGYTHTCTYTYTQRHTQRKDSPSRHASPQSDRPA